MTVGIYVVSETLLNNLIKTSEQIFEIRNYLNANMNRKKYINVIFHILTVTTSNSFGANILGIFPFTSTSHYNVLRPIIQELTKRGHNLTVISPFKDDINLPHLRHIEVDKKTPSQLVSEMIGNNTNMFDYFRNLPKIVEIVVIWNMASELVEFTIKSKPVEEFIINDNSDFDLVICEDFNFVPYYMFAFKYKAPLITILTLTGAHYVNDFMGNPMNIHYVPNEYVAPSTENTLWDKINNILVTYICQIIRYCYFVPKFNRIAREYFSHLPQPLPDIKDIEKNISFVFTNTHFSMDVVRPYLPNIVEIGGIHMKDPKPLPEDLQIIMDNAKDGVIYFSMGSTFPGIKMPKEIRSIFLETFSKLNQTVIWKWENEKLEGKPDNVIIRKWLPQSDLLGHPNVRLFITQGGLLSNIETIYRGVPIVGIPIAVDQTVNMAKAKVLGYGESVDLETISSKSLGFAINKVLGDKKYKEKASELSKLINDKPLNALESAMFWIEYTIRHKGAYHLKTPSSWMPWYEYYLLDVIAIISVVFLIFTTINIYCIKRLINVFLKRIKQPCKIKKRN